MFNPGRSNRIDRCRPGPRTEPEPNQGPSNAHARYDHSTQSQNPRQSRTSPRGQQPSSRRPRIPSYPNNVNQQARPHQPPRGPTVAGGRLYGPLPPSVKTLFPTTHHHLTRPKKSPKPPAPELLPPHQTSQTPSQQIPSAQFQSHSGWHRCALRVSLAGRRSYGCGQPFRVNRLTRFLAGGHSPGPGDMSGEQEAEGKGA
jgi:hypothetical protein